MTKRIECKVVMTHRAAPANRLKPPAAGLPAGETGRQDGRDMPPWPGRAVIQAECR